MYWTAGRESARCFSGAGTGCSGVGFAGVKADQGEKAWFSPEPDALCRVGGLSREGRSGYLPRSPTRQSLGRGPGQGTTGHLDYMQKAFALGLAVPGASFTKKYVSAIEARALDKTTSLE